MKKLIFLICLLPLLSLAQSSKSIEVPDDAPLKQEQREELELREEENIRREWDIKEEAARSREEKQRSIDEERAEQL